MSRVYCPTYVFCPPIHTDVSKTTISDISWSRVHHLSRLLFCPQCQATRPPHQCTSTIDSKYCAMCLADHSEDIAASHCSRKCFVCPKCASPLTISMSSTRNGKIFTFSCGFCPYSHRTRPVTSPQSLHRILADDDSVTLHDQTFHDISKFWSRQNDTGKITTSSQTLENLKLSGLHVPEPVPEPTPITDDTELVALRKSSKSLSDCAETSLRTTDTETCLPKANRLTCKVSVRCVKCQSPLKCPDLTQPPISTKYTLDFNAADFLPTLHATPRSAQDQLPTKSPWVLHEYTISVQNPMECPMNIRVSAPPALSCYFTGATVLEHHVRVVLDTSDYTVPAGSGTAAQMIPVSLLTDNTRASRAEKVRQFNATHGVNWVEMPLRVLISYQLESSSAQLNVRVPLYITIEAELPHPHKKGGTWKLPMCFGYWTIVDLGKVRTHG